MIDLTPFRADLEHICQELRLQRLDVVGSAARDDFSTGSDIDVLVTFRGDDNLFERYFRLKAKLEALFQRKVDIIEERAIRNPFFRKSIEKNRISIYGT